MCAYRLLAIFYCFFSSTGYDFNEGIDYHKLLETYKTSGFQATHFGLAVEELNKMVCIPQL